jgi:DNA-binding CsgD family transcriptional regulator
MHNLVTEPPLPSEGFLLLNSSLNPIYVNRAATEILCYPQRPENRKNLEAFLAVRIQSTLFTARESDTPTAVSEFLSGRRRYQCRAYRVDGPGNGRAQASYAVLLERSGGSFSLGVVSDKFHLTSREQEVLRHLLVGRTTKEIATGMEISPNTVKSFLRMIMLKMSVSTRSGVVGKAFTARD